MMGLGSSELEIKAKMTTVNQNQNILLMRILEEPNEQAC